MEDLRLLAIEQDFVVLEGANGEKFRLSLDESVRKALRGERGPRVESDSISPREIQELVRSGRSVDQIVSETGAPYSFVEKFAVPVLEELEHVVTSAQTVRLSFIGERYGEANHIEFGVLIRDRLDQLGASQVEWNARRNETGGWQITCDFVLDSKATSAKWSFDLRHLSLSPDNEVALNLAANPKGDALIAKPKPVVVVEPPKPVLAPVVAPSDISPSQPEPPLIAKNLTVSLGETQEFAEVIPFGRGRNTTANVPVVAAGTSAEIDDEAVDEIDDSEDLLDGLRRRRDLRESKTKFSPILEVVRSNEAPIELTDLDGAGATDLDDVDDATVWIDSSDEVFVAPEDVSQDQPDPANEATPAPTSTPKRGRATMPSWDEIVFGTKADNKDD